MGIGQLFSSSDGIYGVGASGGVSAGGFSGGGSVGGGVGGAGSETFTIRVDIAKLLSYTPQ